MSLSDLSFCQICPPILPLSSATVQFLLALEERRGGKSARTRIGVQQRRSVAIGPGVGEGARDGMAERGLSCCSKHRQPVLGFLSVVVGRLALPLCPSTTQYSRTRLPHCFFSFLLCSRLTFNSIKHRPLRPLPHLISADNRNGTSVILAMNFECSSTRSPPVQRCCGAVMRRDIGA